MAPNSPESPSKKRKQPINGTNGLKRDQPLFAGRRPIRTLQQPPDFFTDSLNTSYIPSPSPTKSPTRQDVRAKPRQTLGNGRSGPAASKTTLRNNDENKPPSSTSSPDHQRRKDHLKPRPTQANFRLRGPTPGKAARSSVRARTPTSPRGRQVLITSPTASESSPGRGYAEAYQRIVEEENLAQEDSINDTEGVEEYDYDQQDLSQNLESLRPQRLRHLNATTSPRPSPHAMREKDGPADEESHGKEDMKYGSDCESGLDYTENITDTSIDSGSSQYAKDLHRLGSLKSGTKAFSKARMGEKVGLTVDNLQRHKGSNESLGSAFSVGSLSNRGSDPSVNVPKAWGRKAKPGNDWLARINSRSGRFTGDVPKRQSSGDQMIAENQRREWSEPIDQWIATASEMPLPSPDERPSQTRESSQGSTPTTAIPRSNSIDRRRQWEMNDEDFTARSLQVSESPPIRIRNAALNRIRDREMENLEKRAVTTSRLGELRGKSSGESLRRTQSAKSIEDHQQDEQGTVSEPTQQKRPSTAPQPQVESLDDYQNGTPEESLHDEGEPVPDTPVVIYRHKSKSEATLDQKSDESPEDERQYPLRPNHERKDSHDLLKRLSRVTSESPSPTREPAEIAQQSSPTKSEQNPEKTPQTFRSLTDLKTPVITGAWVDQSMSDTPKSSLPDVNLKTPLITGAWVDTPLPTGSRGPPMPTPSDPEERKEFTNGKLGAADLIHRLSPGAITPRPKLQSQTPLKYSGPPLAKSALEEIINEAKSTKPDQPRKPLESSDSEEDPTLHLGESTIQSLEELIANDEDFSTLLAPTPPSPETSNPSSNPSPSSQALTTSSSTTRSSRLTDLQSYTHLLSRLTNLAPSLRASKKQIETLERAVSTAPPSKVQTLINQDQEECNEGGELHDFLFPCQSCGCPGRTDADLQSLINLRDSITTITLPVPRLWRWKQNDWRPKLTWLGVFTILSYTIYLGESYARFKFCHPLYARTQIGYGVDIDAPRPPFVLVKVLYRHTALGTFMAPVYHFLRIALKLLSSLVGYMVGFMFGDEDGSGKAHVVQRQPASRDARIPRPSWGPDLSLMDDEYL